VAAQLARRADPHGDDLALDAAVADQLRERGVGADEPGRRRERDQGDVGQVRQSNLTAWRNPW
jgi:hypothetical protein